MGERSKAFHLFGEDIKELVAWVVGIPESRPPLPGTNGK